MLNYNKADIKILVLSACRTSVASVLASMVSENSLNKIVKNSTLELKLELEDDNDTVCVLKQAERAIKDLFDPEPPCYFDGVPTKKESASFFNIERVALKTSSSFKVLLKNNDKKSNHNISIYTLPGELIDRYGVDTSDSAVHKMIIKELVDKADAIFITVNSICALNDIEYFNKLNRIEKITNLIKDNYETTVDNPRKLISFIPVNCEHLFNNHIDMINNPENSDEEDPMHRLIMQIKKSYAPLINYLTECENANYLDVAILPSLIFGNIEFAHINPNTNDIYFKYRRNDDFSLPKHAPQFCEKPVLLTILLVLEKIKKYREKRNIFHRFGEKILYAIGKIAHDDKLIKNIPVLRDNFVSNENYYVYELLQTPTLNLKEDN